LKDFLSILLKHGVTFAPTVPPILLQLVKSDLGEHFEVTKLKSVLTAAAPLGAELRPGSLRGQVPWRGGAACVWIDGVQLHHDFAL